MLPVLSTHPQESLNNKFEIQQDHVNICDNRHNKQKMEMQAAIELITKNRIVSLSNFLR